ncbi:MAG: ABC transporter ATP-binding protein [Candidatus Omnitrophica bacterium]|nr:ABC transporter ATP-binding protein [Candidatus Omnitrophota bacterium]
MATIEVKKLSKIYKRSKKGEGLKGLVKNIFFREYEEIEALKEISFIVEEGEFVGYIGPNGAGKTTTLKILAGILYPSGGEVKVNNYIPWERKKEFLKSITFVMGQKNQLWWDLPALDSFILLKKIYEISDKEFKKNLDFFSSLLNVSHLLNVPVRKLSLGERMKMELIAALIHSPKIIFLDEPTIGLDILSQEKIRTFLKEYNREFKTTIILTSHYIKDIEDLCERVILIHRGEKIFDEKASTLINKFVKDNLLYLFFKENIPSDLHQFGTILSYNEKEVYLKIPREETGQVIHKLLEKYKLIEFRIERVTLEDVVKEIFRKLD